MIVFKTFQQMMKVQFHQVQLPVWSNQKLLNLVHFNQHNKLLQELNLLNNPINLKQKHKFFKKKLINSIKKSKILNNKINIFLIKSKVLKIWSLKKILLLINSLVCSNKKITPSLNILINSNLSKEKNQIYNLPYSFSKI
jgi:hypothetical protein